MPTGKTFGEVLDAIKSRAVIFAREGWNGKGQFIGLQRPDEDSVNSLPYIYIVITSGDRVPWLASQTDMLAEDWYEISTEATPNEPVTGVSATA